MFVKVADSTDVSVEDSVEIPVESEGFILMSTLIAQFPGACGLKFKTEQSSWRGLRVVDDKLYPAGDDTWSEKTVYVVTFPKGSALHLHELEAFFFVCLFSKLDSKIIEQNRMI